MIAVSKTIKACKADIATKACTKCEQTKSIDEFYRANRPQCKECERTAARHRMGREKHKIARAFRCARKTALEHGAYDDLTLDDVAYTFAVAGGRCAYCGKLTHNLQLEHICPLSRGGSNTLSNITTACKECNQGKHTDAILEYVFMNMDDAELIASLIERMAYRSGLDIMEVFQRLKIQTLDYMQERAIQEYEREYGKVGDEYEEESTDV